MSAALPDTWMDRIWQRLTVRYGQSFLARWAGVDLMDVKADWSEQLARFAGRPDCIKYALENLPEKPPTLGEFRALCNAAPEPNTLRLDAPKSAPPAEVVQAIKAIGSPHDPKAWAYRLKARDEAGDNLPAYSRMCYRKALGME